jgi:DNA repair exonuclease SbcCD ATPase subunit
MKLQIDQIESFDTWLSQTEQHMSRDLDVLEENLSGIHRQYQQLAQLQDELVAQQLITESLQNMIIVVDDSSSDNLDPASKYTSAEIESKLLNLSERWAQICNFVQNRWVELQQIKIEFEQIQLNREKVDKWLTSKEDEMNKIKSDTNITDNDIIMQQVHSIQVIN